MDYLHAFIHPGFGKTLLAPRTAIAYTFKDFPREPRVYGSASMEFSSSKLESIIQGTSMPSGGKE